jgi:hypothetical protein
MSHKNVCDVNPAEGRTAIIGFAPDERESPAARAGFPDVRLDPEENRVGVNQKSSEVWNS